MAMHRPKLTNLFDDLDFDTDPNRDAEKVDRLGGGRSVRIERIVSHGQCSPPGFWYDQHEAEWVMVVRGHAELLFEGDAEPIAMGPGDHVMIPAGRRHRVESTSDREATVWLAVFFEEGQIGDRESAAS